MKKAILFALPAALLIALLLFCDNPTVDTPPSGGGDTYLTIKNKSSFPLTSVVWNGVPFGTIPIDSTRTKWISADSAGVGYITFTIAEKGVNARTPAADPITVRVGTSVERTLYDGYPVEEINDINYRNSAQLSQLKRVTPPRVGKISQSDVTGASFKVNSVVADTGWPPYAETGFCYSKKLAELGLPINCFPVEVQDGKLSMVLSDLSGSTDYFVKAYIDNGAHPRQYSDTAVFVAAGDLRPRVRMDSVANITVLSASLYATVLPTDGIGYTERGFCYSSTDPFPMKDAPTSTTVPVSGTGNAFLGKTQSLRYGTYCARAYIQNSHGVRYSDAVIKFSVACVDVRDGKSYKAVTIGSQTWMAENLNYATANSWCSGGNASNCAIYGRLYTWDAAMNACPVGWYLPSDDDWGILVDYVGGRDVAGKKLKSTSFLRDGNPDHWKNGTDDYGFAALNGGLRDDSGDYFHVGGYWWSASDMGMLTDLAYHWYVYVTDDYMHTNYYFKKSYGFSVRCIASN